MTVVEALAQRADNPPAGFQRGEVRGAIRALIQCTPPGGSASVPLPANAYWEREFYCIAGSVAHGLWGAGSYRMQRLGGRAVVTRVLMTERAA